MTSAAPLPGKPVRTILASAPIRICDIGGWTDTWFSGHGKIFNIAVSPRMEVRIEAFPARGKREIIVNAVNMGQRYRIDEGALESGKAGIIEGVIQSAKLEDNISLQLTVRSEAPAGSATGTSASLAVALLGGLACLAGEPLEPETAARKAHAVETDILQQQSGIQDQLGAALGGINFISMHRYPDSTVEQLTIGEDLWKELENRLMLIYLGTAHHSSAVHEMVIRRLEERGAECRELEDLRQAAITARDAILQGDLKQFGMAMRENTEAQARLHPALVCDAAHTIIDAAREAGASGWKVNGAGGDGGSITLLLDDPLQRSAVIHAAQNLSAAYQHIPITLAREGLTVKNHF